ncbi:Na(+)/H(+) exchange regulatory cofactor NHE-RF1-like [Palaemon carinicauda]|uniref:Na(+)/H(+) exchange regulatory cofactor NHE-RF1-like n=1 Tax=Palaemon carinicauda TaxID=392227 RepID=UPI0035B580E3
MSEIPDNAPSPRLCIIVKWPDFEGYGFNLHAEKSKPGQFIGKIDANSPAEMAGLKQGDRIIEVNGVNIANENHKQILTKFPSQIDLRSWTTPLTHEDDPVPDPVSRSRFAISTTLKITSKEIDPFNFHQILTLDRYYAGDTDQDPDSGSTLHFTPFTVVRLLKGSGQCP